MNELQLDEAGFLQKKPAQSERLQIVHLLLWTALTAGLLGFNRVTMKASASQFGTLEYVASFLALPLLAAGLSAWILMLSRWFNQGLPFPAQPGHWLLLLLGLTAVLFMVLRALLFAAEHRSSQVIVFLGVTLAGELIALVFYGCAIYAARDHWVVLYWVGLGISIVTILAIVFTADRFQMMPRLTSFQCILNGALYPLVLVLMFVDRRRARRRDALHWVGVIALCGYAIYLTSIPFLLQLLSHISIV